MRVVRWEEKKGWSSSSFLSPSHHPPLVFYFFPSRQPPNDTKRPLRRRQPFDTSVSRRFSYFQLVMSLQKCARMVSTIQMIFSGCHSWDITLKTKGQLCEWLPPVLTMDMSTWVTAGDSSLHLSLTDVTGKFMKSTKIEWSVDDCKTKLYFFWC